MGKMKEIAMIMADEQVETLELMISLAKKNERSYVFFRGETYTMEQAENMLNFIYNERSKIHRNQQSTQ